MAKMIKVKRRALIARIQRKLGRQQRRLHTDRRDRETSYLVIDAERQALVHDDVDIEELGRELGCLRPWEKLED